MGIVLALLLFSFIVFFHELGHFLLAKKNGIRVDEFYPSPSDWRSLYDGRG